MQKDRISSLLSSELNSVPREEIFTVETLFKDLQPLIHYTALFIRLVQWKDGKKTKQSLVLLLALIAWCRIHRYVMFLLPLILVITKIQHGTFLPLTYSTNDSALVEDLTEIRNTVWLLASVKNRIQKSDTLCRAYYQYYSVATTKRRSVIWFGVTSLFSIMYAGWTFFVYQQIITGCASLLWFLIVSIMCLYSPWVNPICLACIRAVSPLIYYWETRENSEAPFVRQTSGLVNAYCFQLYHHQRWWFPTGWTNLLLPQDPPVWSDEYLEPTAALHEFKLPPAIYIGKPNELNQQCVASWIWVDPFWSRQKNVVGDKLSWQYGNKWLHWSSQANSPGFFTRRRKWFRYAQRKETWITVNNSCASSLIGGSNTTGSVHSWNATPPISPSTSTSTIFEPRPKPILLKNNMRRSSVSGTFKIPVLSCRQQTVNHSHLSERLYNLM